MPALLPERGEQEVQEGGVGGEAEEVGLYAGGGGAEQLQVRGEGAASSPVMAPVRQEAAGEHRTWTGQQYRRGCVQYCPLSAAHRMI